MYLLAITYAYVYPISFNSLIVIEGLILVSVLWGALYSLNDLTDLEIDRKDRNKRYRAFVQQPIDNKIVLIFIVFLIFSVFAISLATLNPLFTIIMLLMVINQLLYTLPPIRLKDTILAPITSTATNNVLRVASCSILLSNILLVPVSVYLLMFLVGLGTYMMYKEKKKLMHGISILSCILMAYIFLMGDMNIMQFLIIIVPPFLATIPLYLSNFFAQDQLIEQADLLYHKVVFIFYIVCVVVLLFF
jgi:hypothetical protein